MSFFLILYTVHNQVWILREAKAAAASDPFFRDAVRASLVSVSHLVFAIFCQKAL